MRASRSLLVGLLLLVILFGSTMSAQISADDYPVPILLVHGFQLGVISPFFPEKFDLTEDWRRMAMGLTNMKDLKDSDFLSIDIKSSQEKRLLVFWKVRNHPVYISNYTYNIKIPSLADMGFYAANLAREIQEIKRLEGASKIDIIGHSMGGLVARAYIERADFQECSKALLWSSYSYDGDVRKLIMLGTPNHGSPLTEIEDLLLRLLNVDPKKLPPFTVEQMKPGSEFLRCLNEGKSGEALGVEYSAIAGNACPCGSWEQILGWLSSLIGTESPTLPFCDIFERYHGSGDNDFVVATQSVNLNEIPPARYIVYSGINHFQLFTDPEIINKVKYLLRFKGGL